LIRDGYQSLLFNWANNGLSRPNAVTIVGGGLVSKGVLTTARAFHRHSKPPAVATERIEPTPPIVILPLPSISIAGTMPRSSGPSAV